MKVRINLTGMSKLKIEGMLEISGLGAPIAVKKIIDEFNNIQKEQKLTGTVEKI